MAEYDLIERNKIFEKVTELYRYSKGDMHIAYRELLDYILDMPAADVQPVRRGRWVTVRVDGDSETICNNCYENTIMRTDFCSHCGADMRGDENG